VLQREKIQMRIEQLSELANKEHPDLLIKLAKEARTLSKVHIYAQTGKYNE
jgi:hypothetical protein